MPEYSADNLPERFDEMTEDRKYHLLAWIAQNLIPRDTFNELHTSYGLKHLIKDEYYTNGEFKGAMKKLGYKIREARLDKLPYMLVVGAKEEEEGKVSVRSRFAGDEGQKPLAEFVAQIVEEIKNKTIREEEQQEQ